MIIGTIYIKESGEISRTVYVPTVDDLVIQCNDGESYLPGELSPDHYIKDGEVVQRPTMDLTVSSTELEVDEVLRIENIPEGSKVFHPEGELIVDDGYIEWSSVEPGTYLFRFENFPYMEEEVNAVVR